MKVQTTGALQDLCSSKNSMPVRRSYNVLTTWRAQGGQALCSGVCVCTTHPWYIAFRNRRSFPYLQPGKLTPRGSTLSVIRVKSPALCLRHRKSESWLTRVQFYRLPPPLPHGRRRHQPQLSRMSWQGFTPEASLQGSYCTGSLVRGPYG